MTGILPELLKHGVVPRSALVVLCAVLGACAPHKPPPQYAASGAIGSDFQREVAVVADSQAALLAQIARARADGLEPQFVVVAAGRRNYTFAVYASVVRSQHNLLVAGYNALYVFPLAMSAVRYGDAVVATDTLPVVADLPAASVAARSPACPDCSALIADRARIAALTRSWPAQADPWQIAPHYTVWIPLPKNSTNP
jgi:hypothetical protein